MNNISGSFTLTQLKHAVITSTKGQKCIVIPVDDNKLYESEVGNISFDWIAFPKKTEDKMKNTHLIKQSFKKEYLDSLTKEQKEALPIVGNAKLWDEAGHAESAPTANTNTAADVQNAVGDLPF